MARQIRPGQLQENVLYNISASFAISASHEITHEVSSSYAETASFAVTASHLLNNPPAFPFTGDAQITGSLIVSGTVEFRGNENTSTNVVIGPVLGATSANTVVIGNGAGIAFGGQRNVAIGDSAILANNTSFGVALGHSANVTGTNGIALGYSTVAQNGIAIGRDAEANGVGAIAIGRSIIAAADQLRIGDENVVISASLETGDIIISGSISSSRSNSTASFGTYTGDGSQLLGISPFPFTGSAEISGSLVVNSNSTSETLRITQIGTGDAIRIEDSSNPDSTPTVITKDGDVFIGSSSAVTTVGGLSPKLYIKNGSSGYSGDLAIDTAMLFEGSGATYFGTLSPDNVVSGLYMGSPSDVFGSVIRWGYDAGNLQLIAASVGHGITFQVGNKSKPSVSIIPNISSTSDYNATVQVTGSITVLGSVTASGNISSSGTIVSSNLSGTNTGDQDLSSFITNSQTASMSVLSASFATTASHLLNNPPPFPFVGDAVITGSLTITGSFNAFKLNTSNVILGPDAGTSLNAGGIDNVVLGNTAASNLTTGDNNVIIGTNAGDGVGTGGNNVAIGRNAGFSQLGNRSVLVGDQAGTQGGTDNVFLGYQAGAVGTGDYNVAIGKTALRGNSGGSEYNIAIGYEAGYGVGAGDENILVGMNAGRSIVTGNANIIIGSGSLGASALEKQLRIGHADNVIISASLDTGDIITPASITNQGTTRTLFTTASIVYSGSNILNVTQSFGSTEQITNILYSGSFEDGNPLSIAVSGSDGINKLYTLTYSASLVTQIIQS